MGLRSEAAKAPNGAMASSNAAASSIETAFFLILFISQQSFPARWKSGPSLVSLSPLYQIKSPPQGKGGRKRDSRLNLRPTSTLRTPNRRADSSATAARQPSSPLQKGFSKSPPRLRQSLSLAKANLFCYSESFSWESSARFRRRGATPRQANALSPYFCRNSRCVRPSSSSAVNEDRIFSKNSAIFVCSGPRLAGQTR